MKKLFISCLVIGFFVNAVRAQFGTCNCSATIANNSGTVNFSSLSWTHNSGNACPTSGSTSYTGNLCVSMGGNTTLVLDKTNFLLTGDFNLTNTGTNTIFSVPSGDALRVTGNFGDPTNNTMDFAVNGSLQVDGTFYGKNSNSFSGSGSISGGTLSLGNSGSCGSPCPVTGGFTSCSSDGGSNTFCTSSGALPIVLISFKASGDRDKVNITWSTASEQNFDYFSLERSRDGKSFSEIAKVKGNGTTNEMHSYLYEDTNPIIGRTYYRLTSNDFDGYQETFQVVSVNYYGEKKFQVSPNPSDGSVINLNFNFENDADAQVTVYDNVGSAIGTFRVSGSGSINFENTLKSGVYLAKYTSSSFTKAERFLVK